MTTIASKDGRWALYLAVVHFAFGCGGRTLDDSGAAGAAGDGTPPPTDAPPPTCGEICRHVVDSCFPGRVTDQCVRDCEKTRTDFKGCEWLDKFLRCNLTARVLCAPNEAKIDDCYAERNDLVRCKS